MTKAEKMKPEAATDIDTGEKSRQSPKPREPQTETKSAAKTKTTKKSKPKTEKTVKKEVKKATTGNEKSKPVSEEKKEEKKEKDLLVKFTITVPHTKTEEAFNESLLKYANEIKLPGFRRGKVPIEVIKSRYKEAIQDEVVEKVVEKAVFEKIEADKMKIISQPQVKNIDYKEGKDISADIEVEVFPTVELPYLETIEVKIPAAELKIDDYDEKKQIDLVLEAHKRQAPVQRAIKEDDYVMLKTQAKILQTKRMTPRKSFYYRVNEKEPSEILDLAKEIIGKSTDETLTFKRSYPADYHKKPWAGKEIQHHITIESVFEWVKPELNKDFFKSIGIDDEESFKKKLKEEYDRAKNQEIEDKKLKHIIDTLCETIVFPLPRGMVEHEASRMAAQRQQRNPMDFKDEKQIKEYIDSLKPEAEKSVRFTFIVEAIKEKFNLEVSGDDLEKQYKSIAEQNNLPVKEVRKFYMNKENAQNLKDTLLREKVMDLIKGKVTIKEV
ncbi:MAG: trigger factor [Candidatus Aminicenantes bacterium]|jgi:trigger factor